MAIETTLLAIIIFFVIFIISTLATSAKQGFSSALVLTVVFLGGLLVTGHINVF